MEYFARKLHQLGIAAPVGAKDLIDELRMETAYAMEVAIASEEFAPMSDRVQYAILGMRNIDFVHVDYALGTAGSVLDTMERRRQHMENVIEFERTRQLTNYQYMLQQGIRFAEEQEVLPNVETDEETE